MSLELADRLICMHAMRTGHTHGSVRMCASNRRAQLQCSSLLAPFSDSALILA